YRSPDGTLHTLFSNIAYSPNTWTHVAFTRTGNTYKAYINGTLSGTITDSAPSLPTATGWLVGGVSGFQYLGAIDEILSYNRELTSSEFQAVMNGGTYTQTAGATNLSGTLAASAGVSGGGMTLGTRVLPSVVSLYKAEGNANDSADGNNGSFVSGAT